MLRRVVRPVGLQGHRKPLLLLRGLTVGSSRTEPFEVHMSTKPVLATAIASSLTMLVQVAWSANTVA
jgi:hypothetical protein